MAERRLSGLPQAPRRPLDFLIGNAPRARPGFHDRLIERRLASRPSKEWPARSMKPAPRQQSDISGSFAQHDLDAEPHRADKSCDNHGNHCLKGIALRLLDAFAPASQVLKIGA